MLQQFEDYSAFAKRAESESWYQLQEDELAEFDTSHTTLGAVLAQQWKLPNILVEAIYYLYDDSSIFRNDSPLHPVAVDLLAIAKLAQYAVDLRTRSLAGHAEWDVVEDSVMEHLALDEVEVDSIVADVHEALFDISQEESV